MPSLLSQGMEEVREEKKVHQKGLKDKIKERADRLQEIGANAAVPVNASRRLDVSLVSLTVLQTCRI